MTVQTAPCSEVGYSELTKAPDHDCASLFCSQCVNSVPNVRSLADYLKVIAVVDLAEKARRYGTWSKRDIEELVGTYHNYDDWLKR